MPFTDYNANRHHAVFWVPQQNSDPGAYRDVAQPAIQAVVNRLISEAQPGKHLVTHVSDSFQTKPQQVASQLINLAAQPAVAVLVLSEDFTTFSTHSDGKMWSDEFILSHMTSHFGEHKPANEPPPSWGASKEGNNNPNYGGAGSSSSIALPTEADEKKKKSKTFWNGMRSRQPQQPQILKGPSIRLFVML